MSGTTKTYLLTCLCVFLFRLCFQASFFPPYLWGEEASILDGAEAVSIAIRRTSLWGAFCDTLSDYNKGYSWLILPLYEVFGYNFNIVFVAISICVAFVCSLFLLVYRNTYGHKCSLLSIFVAATFALLLVCVRRYKWHTLSYISVTAIYFYQSPGCVSLYLSELRLRIVSTIVFVLSIILYFGNIIFIVPFLIVIFNATRSLNRSFVIICCFFALGVGILGCQLSASWTDRVVVSAGEASKLMDPIVLRTRLTSVLHLFCDYFSPAYLMQFLIGLLVCARRVIQKDRFALLTLLLLLWTMFIQLIIEGLDNPDWINWSMIPIIGMLMIGCDEVAVLVTKKMGRLGALAVCAFYIYISWSQVVFYPKLNSQARHQAHADPYNSKSQLNLVLKLILLGSRHGALYYLPDPNVLEKDGGFNYTTEFKRTDLSDVWKEVTLFKSVEELSKNINNLKHGTRVVVYFSVTSETMLDMSNWPNIAGVSPRILTPFENIYHIKYPVAEYVIER